MTQIDFIKTEIEKLFGKNKWISSKNLVSLGIAQSDETLSRWRKKGEGPKFYRFSSGKFLYDIEDVIEWIHSCKIDYKPKQEEPK